MNITDITSQNEVKPLALQCADPHVYFHTDGYYYFTYMRHRELPLAILVHCFTNYACKALCVSTFMRHRELPRQFSCTALQAMLVKQ